MNSEFELENKHLKNVINQYEDILDNDELALEELPKRYSEDFFLLDAMMWQYEHRIYIMKNNIEKPYFARIDFKEENSNSISKCYIGKVGVIDEDGNMITVDWRAPIASIYYDSNLGKTSYISPEGVIKGELLIKRQYEIENKKLISYQDVDTVSNDEILKPYLGVSADNRLKNIVSTIQKEQNDIIRKDINENLIVQGVAGSGKTTVALHRIAYLVYNYRDIIEAKQYMVIGPNKFFLNYISNVLPDLDVTNVSQLTFEELTKKVVGEKFTLENDDQKLKDVIGSNQRYKLNRIKTSLKYKKALDLFMKDFLKKVISNNDLIYKDFVIIKGNIIKDIYNEIDKDMYYNVESIIERMKLRITKYISDNCDNLIYLANENMHKKFGLSTDEEERKLIIKENESIKKEIERKCTSTIKKYFSLGNTKVLTLYKNFLENLDSYLELDEEMDLERKTTINKLKKKKVEFEDLGAILYLKYKMSETKEYKKFRHAVVDEAQDFGEFNFYILRKLMPNCRFSIFGDLAQSIYDYRSIDNWEDMNKESFDNDCKKMYLLKSYRTTTEIMNEANRIIKYIGLSEATPVIRHGREVEYVKEDNLIKQIISKIKEYQEKDYKSIAIISKTMEETNKINRKLQEENIYVSNVISSDMEYNGGICTITSYLAKGLEFDAVIINNASSKNYNKESNIDMKLLYVSMTRALHELLVLYKEELTEPLKRR